MDASRFDNLTRALSANPSRRGLVRGFAAAAVAHIAILGPGVGDAVGKRKRKNKVKKNQYGCVDVGGKCFGKDARCCSGICDGNGKRSKCVAHNLGGCSRNDNSCPVSIPCGIDGECYRTTGKAGFCGKEGTCDCHPCKKDKDCQDNPEYGPGSACIVCISTGDNTCVNVNGSKGTACVPPALLPPT